ncbi:MAG: hypothetical protein KDD85_06770 [Parvularculaceae bacterium]|nr:hypothetical protein [Parvularculaceae bacterium]
MSERIDVRRPKNGLAAVFKAIILAGAAGGLLDIFGAVIVYGPILHLTKSSLQIFQSVATGVLGAGAFDGGAATEFLGFTLHMFISFVAAAIYVFLGFAIPTLFRRPIIFGHVFGVIVYFVMTKIVVPLSAAPARTPPDLDQLLIAMSLNVFLFGVPIAIVAGRLLSPRADH